MGTASIHEGVRRMRFSDLLDRTEAKELTQEAASELLGINVRTFQRWAERYEAEGDDGLIDRRMGRRSPRRAPDEELERMLGLVRDKYADFTVKHFHEQLQKRHGYVLGYTVTKLALHAAGLVREGPRGLGARQEGRLARGGPGAEGAAAFGAPQEASTPAAAGHAAAPGRVAPYLDRRSAGDGPDRHDGRCDERDLLDAAGRGRRDGVDVPGLGRSDWRARSVLRALHRSRQPLLLHPEGWREGLEDATNPGGTGFIASWDRAYRGLFAAGARALRADGRHAARPAAARAAGRRDQDGRSRQCVAEGALHRRA